MQKNENKNRGIYSSCWYALIVCSLIAAGCAQKTSPPLSVRLMDSDLYVEQGRDVHKADLMEVAKDVLGEMYFTIEKADVNVGLIRTRPLPASQFFEFWRSDNVGLDNTIAANMHTIRRTVTIDISGQGRQLSAGCRVQVQRLSLPERQVSSSARVYGIFSQSSPSLQRLMLNPEQRRKMAWIDLGRDSRLEAKILKRIKTRILQQTSRKLPKTESKT
jgi:prophage DNA circulation protein